MINEPQGPASPTKKRLGRGLSALLGEAATGVPVPADGAEPRNGQSDPGRVTRLPIEDLSRSPLNPRTSFVDEGLEELTQSIRDRGIVQPIIVRPVGSAYEIVAGERRWRAAQRAGLTEVPVVVRAASASEALEIAIIENVQRADLNPIEEASGYERLIAEFGHRQEDLAKLIGKSRSHVANVLRLLKLPASVRSSVAEGSLTAGHARALIGLPNAEALADEVMRRNLSVRATEALAARQGMPPVPHRKASVNDADTRAFVQRLTSRLGLVVSLDHRPDESGTLSIRYTSLEQLESICKLLETT